MTMLELVKILNQADIDYYDKNNPSMSDMEYDKLYAELQRLEKETGIILANSPTQKVSGGVVTMLKKEEHIVKPLSLDKTKDKATIKSWLGTMLGLISYKLDGLTLVLTYRKGKLVKALTRGNGTEGEDVTHNMCRFVNIPMVIPDKRDIIVRGEALITYADFENINDGLEIKYRNPRNLCSGSVRTLDSNEIKDRNLYFYLFDVMTPDIFTTDSRAEMFDLMESLGFTVVPHKTINRDNFDEVFDEASEKALNSGLPVDGLVISYDSISFGRSLGVTAHHEKHSMAFKWSDELYETTMKNVEWNLSRNGTLTPVAVFEPVEIDGTIISRASLHNVSIFKEFQMGKDDIIKVYKANLIIPQVAENLTRSNTFKVPDVCPYCQNKVTLNVSETGVETIQCTSNCAGKFVSQLTHFTSRDGLNIKNLSEKRIESIMTKVYMDKLSDIFTLKNHKAELVSIPKMGEIIATSILDSIEKAMAGTDIEKFLYGIGIPFAGKATIHDICIYYKNDIAAIRNCKISELETIPNIGTETAKFIYDYFNDSHNKSVIDTLLSYVTITAKPITNVSKKNYVFSITGRMKKFPQRAAFEDFICSHGADFSENLTNSVTHLVCNDTSAASSKIKKAKEKNVAIITEDEAIALLEAP